MNPPSEDDTENDDEDDASEDEESDDDVELNAKGYLEMGIVLSQEACHGLREYFKETSNGREGRHLIGNGFRNMVAIDPYRTTDPRVKLAIGEAKQHMCEYFPKKYPNVESVIIKEIQ